MDEKRVQVVISGRVQGVAYRAYCQREASRLGVTGWVRNLRDGRVEALLIGPADRVDQMIAWCRQGPPAAEVTQVDVRETADQSPHSGFRVRMTGL